MKASWLGSLLTCLAVFCSVAASASDTTRVVKSPLTPDADNAGLTLQKGFGAIVVAPEVGRARHIAVSSTGDIYVKLERLRNGNGILVLREDGNGKGKIVDSFGNFIGTGIAIKNGYLYASSNDECYTYIYKIFIMKWLVVFLRDNRVVMTRR